MELHYHNLNSLTKLHNFTIIAQSSTYILALCKTDNVLNIIEYDRTPNNEYVIINRTPYESSNEAVMAYNKLIGLTSLTKSISTG